MGFLPDDPFSHVFDLGYSVYNDIFFLKMKENIQNVLKFIEIIFL